MLPDLLQEIELTILCVAFNTLKQLERIIIQLDQTWHEELIDVLCQGRDQLEEHVRVDGSLKHLLAVHLLEVEDIVKLEEVNGDLSQVSFQISLALCLVLEVTAHHGDPEVFKLLLVEVAADKDLLSWFQAEEIFSLETHVELFLVLWVEDTS